MIAPKRVAVSALLVFAVLAVGVAIGPKRIVTSSETFGDYDLAQFLSAHAPSGSRNLAAFTINGDNTAFAGLGADENTEFEIGSITKTFTAELLADAIERGELTLSTTVGEILGTQSDITLQELATHTSGLPRLDSFGIGDFTWHFFGSNPYGPRAIDQLFQNSEVSELKERGEYAYSNFGIALLGQLIAKNAGTTYVELLSERILQPLGMQHTYLMLPGTVSDNAPRGVLSSRRTSAPWEMEADAPAGGIRSTAKDMERYVRHLLSTGIPDFTWAENSDRVWHNGATGGFTSYLELQPRTGRAIFVVNDSAASVDDLGKAIFEGDV